ncbi:MAG: GTPase ObgE [Verrucomicrobiota bacterium]
MKSHKFVDKVKIRVKAGDGGNGCASFRREKFLPKGGPDGGDGGRGGHVILRGDKNENSLIRLHYNPDRRAEKGGHGKGKKLHGRNGSDLVAKIPCGTEVWDKESGEFLGDIVEHGQSILVARGGSGGKGNSRFKTSTNRAPREFTPGEPGEEHNLQLILKLVADVGLVGLPNAGKSSLLARISHAHPKVAPYPFTTLNPVVGTLIFEDYSRITVADVPGIIKGAHQGVGLGHDFLRHIERSRFLIFVIDMSGTDGRNPTEDYRVIREELKRHKPELAQRPSLAVANKMDLSGSEERITSFRKNTGISPIEVSAATGAGIDLLRESIYSMINAP